MKKYYKIIIYALIFILYCILNSCVNNLYRLQESFVLYEKGAAVIMPRKNVVFYEYSGMGYMGAISDIIEDHYSVIADVSIQNITTTPMIIFNSELLFDSQSISVRCIAIDPATYSDVFKLNDKIVKGHFITREDSCIIIGEWLAQTLNININDFIDLHFVNREGQLDTAYFCVKGTFQVENLPLLDRSVFILLSTAQHYQLMDNQVTLIALGYNDWRNIDKPRKKINEMLLNKYPDLTIKTGQELFTILLSHDMAIQKIYNQNSKTVSYYESSSVRIAQKLYYEHCHLSPLAYSIENAEEIKQFLKNNSYNTTQFIYTPVNLLVNETKILVKCFGLNFDNESNVFGLKHCKIDGNLPEADKKEILIGKEIAKVFSIAVGDKVILLSRTKYMHLNGMSCNVAGILDSPNSMMNKFGIITSLENLQKLTKLDQAVTEILVTIPYKGNINKKEREINILLEKNFPHLRAISWRNSLQNNYNYFMY